MTTSLGNGFGEGKWGISRLWYIYIVTIISFYILDLYKAYQKDILDVQSGQVVLAKNLMQ